MFTRPETLRSEFAHLLLLAGATSLLAGLTLSTARPAHAETRVGGTIRGEVTWSKEGSPYVVTKDVLVTRGSTLTIGPGTTVRFKPDIASREGTNLFDLEIQVKGTLILQGAERDTVYLVSDSPNPRWTDWQGIVLEGKDARLEARAAVITHANEGIKAFQASVVAEGITVKRNHQYAINLIQAKADLKDVLITSVGNSGGTGIGVNVDRGSEVSIRDSHIVGAQNGIALVRSSTGTIENTVVSLCAARGIIIRNSEAEVRKCTISGNDYGIVVMAGSRPVVKSNNIFENTTADLNIKDFDGEEVQLDFSGNWWGLTHLGLIEERVLDGLDDPKVKGFAVLDPILTEAMVPEPKDGAN